VPFIPYAAGCATSRPGQSLGVAAGPIYGARPSFATAPGTAVVPKRDRSGTDLTTAARGCELVRAAGSLTL